MMVLQSVVLNLPIATEKVYTKINSLSFCKSPGRDGCHPES